MASWLLVLICRVWYSFSSVYINSISVRILPPLYIPATLYYIGVTLYCVPATLYCVDITLNYPLCCNRMSNQVR